jgi:hypothetical protein
MELVSCKGKIDCIYIISDMVVVYSILKAIGEDNLLVGQENARAVECRIGGNHSVCVSIFRRAVSGVFLA